MPLSEDYVKVKLAPAKSEGKVINGFCFSEAMGEYFVRYLLPFLNINFCM